MRQGRRTRRRAASAAGWLLAGAALAGCEVEWGGGEISLEDPAPPPDTTAVAEALEPEQIPLPPGPHLHLVRLAPDGRGRLLPIAQIADSPADAPLTPSPMAAEDPTFRTRFDSAFLAPGTELDLLARGGRIGTIVLTATEPGTGTCPSIVTGQAVLPPGQDVPGWAFAAPPGAAPAGPPRRIAPLEATRAMAVAGPVLAERLIGGERAFLARRMDLEPVELPGDTLVGMTATYLIADSLAAGPPGGDAVSLFFMARFEPAVGFIPLWEEVRRYDTPADKEAFEHLDWIPLSGGRLDILRRYDGSSVRLTAGLRPPEGEHEIVWIESEECRALERLGGG